jgi:hypothetical protein
MRTVTAMLLLYLLSAQTGQPPTRPNLSGRWTSEVEAGTPASAGRGGAPSGVAGDMGSGWGSPVTITQDAATLTVEYSFFGRGDLMPLLRFAYSLDGTETGNSVMMGRGIQVQRSRASWQDASLVITTTYPFTAPATGQAATATVTRTLTLQSATALVVDATIAGVLGGPPSTFRTVYRKLP